MKIRLMGMPDELGQAIQALRDASGLELVQVDGPYPNRGNSRLARVYIEARLTPTPGTRPPVKKGDAS